MSLFCRHRWMLYEQIRKDLLIDPEDGVSAMVWLFTWYCPKCGAVRIRR